MSLQHLLEIRRSVSQRTRVILALGRIGFEAVLAALAENGISLPTPRPAFGHGAEHSLGRYVLVASYHPSRQNTQTGRLTPTGQSIEVPKPVCVKMIAP